MPRFSFTQLLNSQCVVKRAFSVCSLYVRLCILFKQTPILSYPDLSVNSRRGRQNIHNKIYFQETILTA